MSRQTRAVSQCLPKFRSTKYNTLFKKNQATVLLQESNYQNIQQKKVAIAQNFRKLVPFTIKKKSTPFTAQITLTSQDPYLKTFTSFMSRIDDKENAINTHLNVVLTHYKSQFDENQSHFTLLDLLIKPLSFIEGEIFVLKKQLSNESFKRQVLKSELKELQFSINKQIADIQKEAMNKLNEFRKMLKHSQISENERKLRNKKELKLLEKGHLLNKNRLESLKDRNLEMQTLIFDCQPLELDHQDHQFLELQDDKYL